VSKFSNNNQGVTMTITMTPAANLAIYKATPCCTDERDCQTWHSAAWVNREQVYSVRGECWIWKNIPQIVGAKSKMATTDDILDSWDLEAALDIRDDKETAKWVASMQNWTPDEVDGLLG
jgi:ribulose 1,5-bisphosphate carboxylase large subunit-like protein